jgi:hypothetical protein
MVQLSEINRGDIFELLPFGGEFESLAPAYSDSQGTWYLRVRDLDYDSELIVNSDRENFLKYRIVSRSVGVFGVSGLVPGPDHDSSTKEFLHNLQSVVLRDSSFRETLNDYLSVSSFSIHRSVMYMMLNDWDDFILMCLESPSMFSHVLSALRGVLGLGVARGYLSIDFSITGVD